MSTKRLSKNTPKVNEINVINLGFLQEETPVAFARVVSSRKRSLHFEKKRTHVLLGIEKIRSILPKSL